MNPRTKVGSRFLDLEPRPLPFPRVERHPVRDACRAVGRAVRWFLEMG